MKRKLLSLFLAAVLTLLLAAAYTSPAFASEDEPFSHNIEYAVEDARVTATPVKDSAYSEDANSYAPDSAIIDLVTETLTLPEGFTAAAFSTDGGSKWKAGAPPAALTKLLNKDLTLHLSSLGIDKATKKPIAGKAASADDPAVPGATIIAFAKIAGRPKDGKLAVNYLPYADNNALTPGQWTLTPKGSTTAADVSGLQIAVAASNKKDPDEFGWGTFKSEQGINVRSTGAGQKPVKTVYLIRSAPKGGSNAQAASKPYKVTASGQLAQPKLKANYKDETLKPKAGMSLSGTGITTVIYAKGAPELKGVSFSTAIDPPVDPNPPGDPDPPEVPDPPVDPGTYDDSGAGTLGAEASCAEEAAEAT
ncbi:MAG: hypothetical protein FWG93_07690, partial [Oscillospiraceae bacterium]|nr:hypothetical protein [Oscillospiraceae bacterium]